MELHISGQDYLKAIYILQMNKGLVRSVDVAERMGVSKPSVSHAVKLLREGGFLVMDDDYTLHLTDLGREVAEKFYERHQYFSEQLTDAGVDADTAEAEAVKWSIRSAMRLSKNSEDRGKKLARMQIPVISSRARKEALN